MHAKALLLLCFFFFLMMMKLLLCFSLFSLVVVSPPQAHRFLSHDVVVKKNAYIRFHLQNIWTPQAPHHHSWHLNSLSPRSPLSFFSCPPAAVVRRIVTTGTLLPSSSRGAVFLYVSPFHHCRVLPGGEKPAEEEAAAFTEPVPRSRLLFPPGSQLRWPPHWSPPRQLGPPPP